jgi:hypothetical protein
MPAQSVDPRIDEQREHEAVECASDDDAGEQCQHELDPANRAAEGLTARTYPVGGTGSRCGSDQRAVMPSRVGQRRADSYSAVWAMSSSSEYQAPRPLAGPPTPVSRVQVQRPLERATRARVEATIASVGT